MVKKKVAMADDPEGNASACPLPSSSAILSSRIAVVGLPDRAYAKWIDAASSSDPHAGIFEIETGGTIG